MVCFHLGSIKFCNTTSANKSNLKNVEQKEEHQAWHLLLVAHIFFEHELEISLEKQQGSQWLSVGSELGSGNSEYSKFGAQPACPGTSAHFSEVL